MVEVEAVDGVLGLQTSEPEAAIDRAGVTRFELAVQQGFESFRGAEILAGRISQGLVQMLAPFPPLLQNAY
jgi:hypothetical protein